MDIHVVDKIPEQHGIKKDELGNKYGRLTVIESAGSTEEYCSYLLWKCKCECGNVAIVRGSLLRSGHTKSCGCLQIEAVRKTGLKPGKRLPTGETAFNAILSGYKYRAQLQGRTFELTKEEFMSLTKQNCTYCGCPPSTTWIARYGDEYIYNGVDRVNNEAGYVTSNVAPCCKNCNLAKGALSVEEFLTHAKRIATHQQKREV
jgi:hypothetical protein